jgi:hypothetical protein
METTADLGPRFKRQVKGDISMLDPEDDGPSNPTWIRGAIRHPGALHRELGVPAGQTIPAKKLSAARHSKNPTIRREVSLADTLRSMQKGK